ncbi:MAG: hypothetical protein PVG76_14335, partial [Chromatiales bacterium]
MASLRLLPYAAEISGDMSTCRLTGLPRSHTASVRHHHNPRGAFPMYRFLQPSQRALSEYLTILL